MPAADSTRASITICVITRPRDAPSATSIASSRRRACARASISVARLETRQEQDQPGGAEQQPERRFIGGAQPADAVAGRHRGEAKAAIPIKARLVMAGRERGLDQTGAQRAHVLARLRDADAGRQAARSRSTTRNRAARTTCRSRLAAQIGNATSKARPTSSPVKSGGATPMIGKRCCSNVIDVPSTARSPPNRDCQNA